MCVYVHESNVPVHVCMHTFHSMLFEYSVGKVTKVMSLRNPLQKMSKSDNQELSCIYLSDDPDTINKKVRRAVTDCQSAVTYEPKERPGVSNLVSIYSTVTGLTTDEVMREFHNKDTGQFKTELSEVLIEHLRPVQEKLSALEADPEYVQTVLDEGAEKAANNAAEIMRDVRSIIGLAL